MAHNNGLRLAPVTARDGVDTRKKANWASVAAQPRKTICRSDTIIGLGQLAATNQSYSARRPCAFFMTSKGCRNGSKCPFVHDKSFVATKLDLESIRGPAPKAPTPAPAPAPAPVPVPAPEPVSAPEPARGYNGQAWGDFETSTVPAASKRRSRWGKAYRDYELWQDMVDEPWKYGVDMAMLHELNAKLMASDDIDRCRDYLAARREAEYAKVTRVQAPWRKAFAPIAAEVAAVCMTRWINRDIKAAVAKIKAGGWA